ncbi:MAG: hypothetical protein LBC53_01985 [Spirochaetaceae bacterium]|jgi:hypothetical protein|nr:hypothetical protein [Spirochaetaceae bacterium]
MAFKYLYVLVSADADFYYEQFYISAFSLKMRVPGAFVSVLTDDSTAPRLSELRVAGGGGGDPLIDEIVVPDIPADVPQMIRSRFLKTSMRKHIAGDFLYIDADTVVAEDLSCIEDINADLAMALDMHGADDEKWLINVNEKKYSFYNSLEAPLGEYYNSGVILCRDVPRNHVFFKDWHKNWLDSVSMGVPIDQPSLHKTNAGAGFVIKELDGIWNCQIKRSHILAYLAAAKIIHYFGSWGGGFRCINWLRKKILTSLKKQTRSPPNV